MNISNSVSSISTHQSMMNTNANNIANVNTDRFVPSDTRVSSNSGSVMAHTRMADDTGSMKSQTDLAKEIPEQMVVQGATAANVTSIKTQDEMLGSLLDIKA